MLFRTIPTLLVALLLISSLAATACGPGEPEFELSNLQLSETNICLGDELTISVDVENIGGSEGDKTVNFSVNGEELTKTVTVDADDEETASIKYTPTSAEDYTVTTDGLSKTFTARVCVECPTGAPTQNTSEWWVFDYEVVDGEIVVIYSLYGETYSRKVLDYFPKTEMTVYFSKELTDNVSREFKIDGESFVSEYFETVFAATDTTITLSLGERKGGQFSNLDCTGTLYVADDASDADVTVTDEPGKERAYTIDGGCVAGDIVMDFPLFAHAVALASDIFVNMPTKATTGHTINELDAPGRVIDIAPDEGKRDPEEATGSAACEGDGTQVAPYVGTSFTIVAAAAEFEQSFIGFTTDFQMVLTLELEPK